LGLVLNTLLENLWTVRESAWNTQILSATT